MASSAPCGRRRSRAAGPNGSGPQELSALNGLLVFTADDGHFGRELWAVRHSTEALVTLRIVKILIADHRTDRAKVMHRRSLYQLLQFCIY